MIFTSLRRLALPFIWGISAFVGASLGVSPVAFGQTQAPQTQTPSSSSASSTPPTAVSSAASETSAEAVTRTEAQQIVLRQEKIAAGEQKIRVAETDEFNGDLKAAHDTYLEVITSFGLILHDSLPYRRAVAGLTRIDIKIADNAAKAGETAAYKAAIEEAARYSPDDPAIRQRIALLNEAVKSSGTSQMLLGNPAMSPKFNENVNDVENNFIEAEQFFRTGQYDEAANRYKRIILIDPYNEAARKGLEKVISQERAYAGKAQLENRAKRLEQVEAKWAAPISHDVFGNVSSGPVQPFLRRTDFQISQKLRSIVLPEVNFNGSSIKDAAAFFSAKSREFDPDKHGVDFVVKKEAEDAARNHPITLSLRNIPLGEALRYVTTLAGVKAKLEEYAVFIVPLTESSETLLRRSFNVSPNFFTISVAPTESNSARTGGRPPPVLSGAAPSTTDNSDVKSQLEQKGVVFKPDPDQHKPQPSATYLPEQGILQVYNTQEQLDYIEELVLAGEQRTLMVEVSTKFVEIAQTDLNDLTFNYGLNLPNLPLLGGPNPNSGVTPPGGFYNPFGPGYSTSPQFGTALPGSQGFLISSLDALLGGANAPIPNSAKFSGQIDGLQYAAILTALEQKKSTDLLSEPSVRVRSGEDATINVSRTFYYPTAFDPPQSVTLVQSTTISTTNASLGPPTVIPAFPNQFDKQDIGVLLKAKPQVTADARTIDLNLFPEVTEFEGFIDYGTPIFVIDQANTQLLLTNNNIPQPVFNRRRVNTKVSVRDGYTVVLGGLIREDIQSINDKVPILGDLPMVGRLFQSKATENIKRNLMIFVTNKIYLNNGELLNPPDNSLGAPVAAAGSSVTVAPSATR